MYYRRWEAHLAFRETLSMYTHLFFDIDHTLWDFETNSEKALEGVYEAERLAEKGIPDFNDFNLVYHAINDKLWERFRKGFLSREDLRWKRMWQTLMHYRVPDEVQAKRMSELYLELLPQQRTLFPHAVETLSYLQGKGYSMHLITNGFEATQHQKLQNAGIQGYFDKMITSEAAMSIKPQAAIFHYALREAGATAATSVMIGDAWEIDILGARDVGMAQVFFNPKGLVVEEKPTFEIQCLSELIQLF